MKEAVKEGYGGGGGGEGGLRRGIIILRDYFFLLVGDLLDLQGGELSSVVGLDQYRHWFAGGFGHGGQDIHMISWS
jgi:hypothetical protein